MVERAHRRRWWAWCVAVVLTSSAANAQEERPPPRPGPLREAHVEGLRARWDRDDHWALRALILVSLGEEWHPSAVSLIRDGLAAKDVRLRAYAVEALRLTQSKLLRSVVDTELMEQLIRDELPRRNAYYQTRISEVLARIVPGQGFVKASQWGRWWSRTRRDFKATPWNPPELPPAEAETRSLFDRGLALRERGLDVVFCIDSTRSMQPAIDATRGALRSIVAILEHVAPDLRVGLVHYRDQGDLRDGAQVLETLTRASSRVQQRVDKLNASGGGDVPELVDRGLEVAVGRTMGWAKETEKLVVILGDAPPKHSQRERTLELARNFHRPVTGDQRGGIVSTIAVGTYHVRETTRDAFEAIAKAGGGQYGELLTDTRVASQEEETRELLEHVVKLCFGARWEEEVARFVATYLQYTEGEVF